VATWSFCWARRICHSEVIVGRFSWTAGPFKQFADLCFLEFDPVAALESWRQGHDTEAYTHQPADLQSQRFEHAAHNPVPALLQYHAIPAVAAFAALIVQHFEPGVTIGKPHAGLEFLHVRR